MTKARSSRRSRTKPHAGTGERRVPLVAQRETALQTQGVRDPFDLQGLLPLFIIVAGIVAYCNSFSGVLVFDDEKHIPDNPRIRHVLPLSETMGGRRPIVDLSLAINYKYGYRGKDEPLDLTSFHVFNLSIHLLAGLTLFGVIRRTLLRETFQDHIKRAAPWLALVVSMIWVVHPLQTQSVTYLIQRGESMMGLCYLLTLYCVIRGTDSVYRPVWYVAAITVCALGMGSKAVMVTAPVVVLLYDWLFLSRSFLETLTRRWPLYLGLAVMWFVLVVCGVVEGVLSTSKKNATVGFSVTSVSSLQYLLTQPGVIAYYLKLSFWPDPLCLDYNWPVVGRIRDVLLPSVVILPLLAGTVWGLVRKHWVGFVGGWFFITLAPTSSFIPMKDLFFEHRMYLPVAAVIVLVTALGHAVLVDLARRLSWGARGNRPVATLLAVVVTASLTYGTVRRNTDYHDALGMWRDVIAKRPNNHRAFLGLGTALFNRGKSEEAEQAFEGAKQAFEEAEQAFEEAVRLKRSYPEGWYNLGNALAENGKLPEAVAAYETSLRFNPRYAKAHYNLANTLKKQRRFDDAIAEYQLAIEYEPKHIAGHINLGNTLKVQAIKGQGHMDEAVEMYLRALEIDPNHANAHHNLGDAYFLQNRYAEAEREFLLARKYNPNHEAALRGLNAARAQLREADGD